MVNKMMRKKLVGGLVLSVAFFGGSVLSEASTRVCGGATAPRAGCNHRRTPPEGLCNSQFVWSCPDQARRGGAANQSGHEVPVAQNRQGNRPGAAQQNRQAGPTPEQRVAAANQRGREAGAAVVGAGQAVVQACIDRYQRNHSRDCRGGVCNSRIAYLSCTGHPWEACIETYKVNHPGVRAGDPAMAARCPTVRQRIGGAAAGVVNAYERARGRR